MRFIAALLRALVGFLTLPLQLLGWTPRARPGDVAADAIRASRAATVMEIPPVPQRKPEPTPVADLVQAHSKARLFNHEQHAPLPPLPRPLEVWLSSLTDYEHQNACWVDAEKLQAHINAGLGGSTAPGPYRLPPVLPEAALAKATAQKGSTGGTTQKRGQDVEALLAELGLEFGTPSYGPRR